MAAPNDRDALSELLSGAGFVAAQEEADELLAAAVGDIELLATLVRRRLTGEPLAWITGSVSFCGVEVRVGPGVYVPRRQSETLARRASSDCPERRGDRPLHGVRGDSQDPDDRASRRTRGGVGCRQARRHLRRSERRGGLLRRLFAPLPRGLEGGVDVVIGVVPYVPKPELRLCSVTLRLRVSAGL